MPNTSRLGLHYPAQTDQANIPTDLQTLAGQIDTIVTAFYQASSQPSAALGALWWDTVVLALNYSDGVSWYPVGNQVIVSTTTPLIIAGGQFWFNPNTSGFQYYNGTSYVTVIPPITTNGQYLTSSATGPVWTALPAALPPNGSAGGSLAGTYPNPTLATTGVSASTYGSSTTAPQIAINTEGRITSASSVTITGVTPGGSAGGDLTGTYPNPTLGAVGTAGTYGSASVVPTITTDSKGRVTSVTTNTVNDSAKVPLSTVTTAGDIIYGTSSAAVSRLGIGTTGQILTVNTGATAPQWSTFTFAPNTALVAPTETANIVSGGVSSSLNIDVITSSFYFYNANSTGNFTLNVRGNSGTTLNSILSVGQSISVTLMNTNGSTPYYLTQLKIDSTNVTPQWQGASTPSAGNASSTDTYSFMILKTAANTYKVLASLTQFA